MKKSHILGILIIAMAIVVIMSTAGDASAYVTFEDAKEMASSGNANKIHVVGKLRKDENGNVIGIHPSPNMLSFKFEMVDENNEIQTVYHANPMPTDFLRSEQVVVVGAYQNDRFVAEKILLKCPSKYQEEGVNV
ncbi:cytochrome c maturation protein CcmE domain-containing protein [Marinoscillum furvescens]|uniref:Cytochrome c-type biogenesis protein CcmE n=1 Tax=Marinoscillum furvescens DSM 4134 TaxID=1122208 RepID=A0A3D9L6F0_MARFU|nr:cytochrome c maturation protein CcmE [Marinoscillum furvescens]REE01704.1 cytochrome c-type biogenesis protein CcmE [Marinoscillum furvescens DSM 4134]